MSTSKEQLKNRKDAVSDFFDFKHNPESYNLMKDGFIHDCYYNL